MPVAGAYVTVHDPFAARAQLTRGVPADEAFVPAAPRLDYVVLLEAGAPVDYVEAFDVARIRD